MKEKIYIHKVKMNCENGWGQSMGITTEVLGIYKDFNTALDAKKKRDLCEDACHFDTSKSWIDEETLQ